MRIDLTLRKQLLLEIVQCLGSVRKESCHSSQILLQSYDGLLVLIDKHFRNLINCNVICQHLPVMLTVNPPDVRWLRIALGYVKL